MAIYREARNFAVEVSTMIRTGASRKAVEDFVENLYISGKIASNLYECFSEMIIVNYGEN